MSNPEAPGEAAAAQLQAELRARADRLAVSSERAAPEAALDLIEFVLGRERYAVETAWVREVALLPPPTPLPGVPPFVLGLIQLHGQILAVIDVKRFFGLPQEGISNLNRVVVLRHGSMLFGVLVDEVVGVRRIAHSAIQSALANLSGIDARYLKGVTSERLIVLDARAMLDDSSLIVDQTVEPAMN